MPNNPGQKSSSQALQLQALIALLKAETAELRQKNSSSASGGGTGGRSGSGSGSTGSFGGGSGGGSGAAVGRRRLGRRRALERWLRGRRLQPQRRERRVLRSASGSGTASGTAQAILQSTSTQVVVTVDLDATKQTEAAVGEPVTVELPDGTTVNGKITEVSPVAQTSSSSSSGTSGVGRRLGRVGIERWLGHAVGDDPGHDRADGTPEDPRP